MDMKDRILQIMREAGMSQSDFSKATGIPAASLSSIFTGRTAPTMKHAEAIHRYCPTLSLTWLLFGEGNMHLEEDADGSSGTETTAESGVVMDPESGLDQFSQDMAQEDGMQGDLAVRPDLFAPTTRASHLSNVRARETVRVTSRSIQDRQNMSRIQHADVLPSIYGNTMSDANTNLYKQSKKIVEIRIFFDDGTFETFQGNQ